ncbi:MAG: hypothetical protein JXA13_12280 [Anaerolineales bacterium]|nr:hypothetical protein [Anaerolineales bacterium]
MQTNATLVVVFMVGKSFFELMGQVEKSLKSWTGRQREKVVNEDHQSSALDDHGAFPAFFLCNGKREMEDVSRRKMVLPMIRFLAIVESPDGVLWVENNKWMRDLPE